MQRAVITVVGKDTVGLIATVCTRLAEEKCNILDITQSIVDGFFNMMMIVDVTDLKDSYGELSDAMEALGNEIGVQIRCQKEEIFDSMHRI